MNSLKPRLRSALFGESEQLFAPLSRPSSPILVTDCARAVWAARGTIWLVLKSEYGFLLRCQIKKKSFRIIIPALVGESIEIPEKKGVPTHVVLNLCSLKRWLSTLAPLI